MGEVRQFRPTRLPDGPVREGSEAHWRQVQRQSHDKAYAKTTIRSLKEYLAALPRTDLDAMEGTQG